MLNIQDLRVVLGGIPLLDGASAQIPTGHKVGVVGRNGSGKSTLFRIIKGELAADDGVISTPRGARIGALAQEAPGDGRSLIDTVLAFDQERTALMVEADQAEEANRIAEIQLRLTEIDAHSAEARAATILAGLGFDRAAQARPSQEYSGGWRMRVALAGILFSRPDILLLDEPTNYLDLEGTMWLEAYLARYPATALIISHDRSLLNRAVNAILHLENRRFEWYSGAYDQFDAERRANLAHREAQRVKQEAARAHMQSFVDRFRYKASKAKQAQSRLKMLARMAPIAAAGGGGVASFSFPDPEELAPPLISFSGVSVGYDDVAVLSGLDLRIDQDDRIALLGANGQGKSTLAKLIAGRLQAMSGEARRSRKLRVGFFAQHQLEELTPGDTPLQHMARLRPGEPPARLRSRLGAGGVGANIVESPVERLSGGQKARLLMALMTIEKPHLVILDEPTNHLDIESREALMQALNAYQGAVILISHDPHLIEAVADRLWLVKNHRVRPFGGDMDDYRALLLSERGGPHPAAKQNRGQGGRLGRRPDGKGKPGDGERPSAQRLKAEARACESRVVKLQEMLKTIDDRLADPNLYADGGPSMIAQLQRKRAEIMAGVDRAEAMWLEAEEQLEQEKTPGAHSR